jgi:hypothetical protein
MDMPERRPHKHNKMWCVSGGRWRHGTDLNPGSTSIVGSADGHCDHHLPYVRTTMASM